MTTKPINKNIKKTHKPSFIGNIKILIKKKEI